MTLDRHRRDWEDLAALDPLWAILSDPGKRYGGWDAEAFFATGQDEVDEVVQKAAARFGRPVERGRALDFGCGVGRVTRGLAAHFEACVGVDVSEGMVQRAERLNAGIANRSFRVNGGDDLAMFGADSFDLVYSDIVLQHLPEPQLIDGYVGEFVRVLRPGGLLVFQLPERLPVRHRLQLRRRLFGVLRAAGAPARFLYRPLGLHPVRMIGMPQRRVVSVLEAAGATVLDVEAEPIGDTSMQDRTYYATKHRPGSTRPPTPSEGAWQRRGRRRAH